MSSHPFFFLVCFSVVCVQAPAESATGCWWSAEKKKKTLFVLSATAFAAWARRGMCGLRNKKKEREKKMVHLDREKQRDRAILRWALGVGLFGGIMAAKIPQYMCVRFE